MDEETYTFRRYRRQPAANVGSTVFFDAQGRMFDVRDPYYLADFQYVGHVIEVDEQGMLISFVCGREPPERG